MARTPIDGASGRSSALPDRVSVVIPARNAAEAIADIVRRVLAQAPSGVEVEVLVVDDASTDDTPGRARAAGARVLSACRTDGGNPAAARNRGAAHSTGDPIIFLDADCVPADGWLAALLAAHRRGELVVAGSLDLPAGLPWTARVDYYCGWYLVHPRRPAGPVPHHPPPNLSVRREAFFRTSGFAEEPPYSYTNEERVWQAEFREAGGSIYFEPKARAYHHNRPGFLNLLRRNYRWAYTAVPAKAQTRTARMAWLYSHPWLLVLGSPLLAPIHTAYILGCWLRAGILEPVVMLPWILASRFAYAAGLAVGAVRWLRYRGEEGRTWAPRWE